MSNLKVLTNLDNKQDVYVSGTLKINSDTSFNASITRNADGMYDVDGAVHALDTAIENNYNNIQTAYESVRFQYTGSFNNSGVALLNLTNLAGATYFADSNLKDINVQVLVDTENDGRYKNDLVSVELYVDGSSLMLTVDAPASPNKNYRVLAINETVLPLA